MMRSRFQKVKKGQDAAIKQLEGFLKNPNFPEFPKLQISTIEIPKWEQQHFEISDNTKLIEVHDVKDFNKLLNDFNMVKSVMCRW